MHLSFKVFFSTCIFLYGLGTQFLILPYSTQQLSLGSHPTLFEPAPVNPVLFSGRFETPDFSLSRGKWLGDISLAQASFHYAKKNIINQISLKYSGLNDLEFRNEVPKNDPSALFSSYGLALSAGSALQSGDMRVGFLLSYVQFGIYTEVSSGLSMNLGYVQKFRNNFKLGLSLNNIGKMSKLSSQAPHLPTLYSFGISKDLIIGGIENSVFGSIDFNSLNKKYIFNVGHILSWKALKLFNGCSLKDNQLKPSFGFQANVSRYSIGYGISFMSEGLGTPQMINLRMTLP